MAMQGKNLLAWADVWFVVLEGQPLVRRVGPRGAEVPDEDQRLQVVGEAMQLVWERSVVAHTLERVTYFQNTVVLAVDVVIDERVIHPLAEFVRHRGYVLRKCAHFVYVSCVGISLAAWLGAVRVVVAADAAAAGSQIRVIENEEREDVRRRPELGHEALYSGVVEIDIGETDGDAELAADRAGAGYITVNSLLWLDHGLHQNVVFGVLLDVLPPPGATLECVDILGVAEIGRADLKVDT